MRLRWKLLWRHNNEMLVHVDVITAAYEQIGFALLESGPDFYVYGQGDERFFHHTIDGELETAFVLEQAALWNPEVAVELRQALAELL